MKTAAARLLSFGEWTELLGVTQPVPGRLARISAPFEGRLLSVLSDAQGRPLAEGQVVKAGDVTGRLDTRVLEAGREEAQATLRDLDEQKRQADLAIETAKLEVTRLEEIERTDAKLLRYQELSKARIALQDAESRRRGVLARQAAGQAKVKALTEQIELSTLRAPIDGRLGLVQVAPGQSLAVGTAIAEVIDLGEIDVLSYVPPSSAARLALGQPARVRPSGETGTESGPVGKIVFVAVQAQPETGNYAVKARFANTGWKLRANAVVTVEVQTQVEKERLSVPDAALMEDQDPPAIVVFRDLKVVKNKDGKEEKQGKAKRLRAILGVRDRGWHVAEIVRLEDPETKEVVPLKEAMIIVEGGNGLHDGDLVKIQEEED